MSAALLSKLFGGILCIENTSKSNPHSALHYFHIHADLIERYLPQTRKKLDEAGIDLSLATFHW